MTNKLKIKIHPSFYFFIAGIIALGYIKQLLLIYLATTIHEMSHVITAKLFGYKTESILITPIGETAVIADFDSMVGAHKYAVIFAGPLSNIIPAAALYFIGNKGFFMQISFIIGIFNLLPIYPLDGGKIIYTALGNRIGIVKSGRITRKLTKAGIFILCVAGFAQTILYPFNMSLIAIGAFLAIVYKKERESMVFSFYRCMLNKYKRLDKGIQTKALTVDSENALSIVYERFTWDYYHIVHIVKDGKLEKSLTEWEIFEHMSRIGE